MASETESWQRLTEAIGLILKTAEGEACDELAGQAPAAKSRRTAARRGAARSRRAAGRRLRGAAGVERGRTRAGVRASNSADSIR